MILRHLVSTVAMLIAVSALHAQHKADSVLTSEQYNIAFSSMTAGKYQKAAIEFQKAADVYKKGESWEKHVLALNMISDCNWRTGQFGKATEVINLAIKTGKKHLPKDNLKLADCYTTLGIICAITEKYDLADQNYKLALEINTNKLGTEHVEVAKIYNNIGILQSNLWNYDAAIAYHEKALRIRRKNFGEFHNDLYSSYDNLAFCYIQKHDINRALEYSLKAVSIGENVHGKEHPRMSTGYNTLAITYALQRDFDKSLETYFKALKINSKVNNGKNLSAAIIMNNVGRLFMKKGEYDEALDYFNRQLAIYLEVLGEFNGRIGNTYSNIGEIHNLKKEYKKALSYHLKAIKVKSEVFGKQHMQVARSYNQLGISLNGLGNFESLNNFQNALMANIPDFNDSSHRANPVFDQYLDIVVLLQSLKLKAETFHQLYQKTKEVSDLELALETYMLCVKVIDKNRQTRLRYKDKFVFSKTSKEVYIGAIQVSNAMSKVADFDRYNEQAFYFAEKSKSAVLYENISNSYAKKFTGLSERLITSEQNLKSMQSHLQSLIYQNQGYDTAKLKLNKTKLFDVNSKLDSISTLIEVNYPKYYQLKYQNTTITPEEIQKKLTRNQAFIEYFESNDVLHVFAITKEKFWTRSLGKDSVLSESINQYVTSFDPNMDFSVQFPQFTRTSNILYQKLIEPVLNELTKEVDHLIIVPTDKLSYVPWGLLVQEDVETSKQKDYKSLNYLLNDYSISYAYSASLLFQDIYVTTKANKFMLAYAPTYDEKTALNYMNLPTLFRDELTPLKWNTTEVNQISKLFDGSYKNGSEATEKSFKENASEHNIIHLAMHAFVDDDDPMLSKLVFFQDNDSIEDGMLHTYELFNMDLAAEMVVLSACKTGLGKIQEGEGMMSLGRAFSYAGCPSLVTSHWSVDDESTSQLITTFYKHIADGLSKDKALRLAKLNFLEQTNGAKTHPYYWGSFVVMGDTAPVSNNKSSYLTYALLSIGLLAVAYFIYRKRVSVV